MLWSALRLAEAGDALPLPSAAPDATVRAALQAVAVWALQFTPRVTLQDEAVLMELAASVRLFGGMRALRERLDAEAAELGVRQVAWGPNGLSALAFARAEQKGLSGMRQTTLLADHLDALPMHVLSASWPHQTTLAHIGCRTLGDVRRLPRGGMARRFDKHLLQALDQLYGHAPEAHVWVQLPEVFEQRLELPFRVDDASALVFGARRLLLQLAGWLAARHSGVTVFTLHWLHDTMRARGTQPGDALTVRTAEPTRQMEHLSRLLAEHLAHVTLEAPVCELRLSADEVHALTEVSASWLPDDPRTAGSEPLPLVLERVSARLGPDKVVRPHLQEDHRLEWMCQWQPVAEAPAGPLQVREPAAMWKPVPRKRTRSDKRSRPSSSPSSSIGHGGDLPQPSFILAEPLRLLVRHHRPHYQGELQLLMGPQRIEGGWWDRDVNANQHRNVMRDYWVAFSEHAGLLWVFQTRLQTEPAWFLHGHFA